MSNPDTLTPNELFEAFCKDPSEVGWAFAGMIFNKFIRFSDKATFFKPTIQFMKEAMTEDVRSDDIRAWGPSVLECMEGKEAEEAFRFLVDLLKNEKTPEQKRTYRYTRFYAVRAIQYLAKSEEAQAQRLSLLQTLAYDEEEDYVTQALACILIALEKKNELWNKDRQIALKKIQKMLSKDGFGDKQHPGFGDKQNPGEYWPAMATLFALEEFPLPDVCKDVFDVFEKSPHYDHKISAINTLGSYYGDEEVVHKLGIIVKKNKDSYLRLLAVMSLGKLGSQED